MPVKISAIEATKILGISHSELAQYDDLLKPEITTRGTKMKTRKYDEAFIRSVQLPARKKYPSRKRHVDEPYVLRKGQDTTLAAYSAATRSVWNIHKSNTQIRGYVNDITIDTYVKIASQPCDYCGEKPKTRRIGTVKEPYIGHGIDRVDNTKGYIEGNMVTCCGDCNRMKFKHSREAFIAKCEQITKHQQAVAKRTLESDASVHTPTS